jgi:NADH:ubiquinone oxidoreductase subunit 5 (subunit L)/multisubunit Na+/H+ antiporter MnhA subunit
MRGEEGYSRFFAYTNLFIASMVVLVLADNLLLMYLGWEGVGLCSYLLIGFYYKDPANGAAAMKAFIVTRVGDVFLAIRAVHPVPRAGHAEHPRADGAGSAETGGGRYGLDLGDPDVAGWRGR